MPEVVSPIALAFRRGQRDYHAGRECPPKDFDDDGPLDERQAAWLGWMFARGAEWIDGERAERNRQSIKRWAEEGGPLWLE